MGSEAQASALDQGLLDISWLVRRTITACVAYSMGVDGERRRNTRWITAHNRSCLKQALTDWRITPLCRSTDKKYVTDWLDYHLAIKYPLQLLV